MKIKINTIITLDNFEQFMVLSETMYENFHYFLVMGLNSANEPDSSKVAIFKEEIEQNEVYVEKITDSDTIITLTKLLKSQM